MKDRIKRLIVIGLIGMTVSSHSVITFADDQSPVGEAVTEAANEVSEVNSSQSETPETQAPETQAPETQAPETQAPETQAPETQAPETQIPETQAPETQAPETQIPETQAPETQAPETQVPETQAPETETQESETQAPETQTSSESTETENSDNSNSPYSSNAELLSHQNIVSSVKPVFKDFRFTKIDAEKGLIGKDTVIYEEKNSDSRHIGIAQNVCYIYLLQDEGDWVYAESGTVRGFVKKEKILSGNVMDFVVARDQMSPESVKELISPGENKAIAYTTTTVQDVIADKDYALAKVDTSIFEGTNGKNDRVIGRLPENGLAYILEETGHYYFIESGNVRGFVLKYSVEHGADTTKKVKDQSEGYYAMAEELIAPEDNQACYYTIKSVQKADDTSAKRKSIVEFALQFVGNPYVWGGTSLTNGADCSGFVQSIYANYGYSLPRVACDQAGYGTQIPVSEAEPGDLIFYAENGYVYHVSMYIGEGQVVHAYNSNAGIVVTGIGGDAVWATKILS